MTQESSGVIASQSQDPFTPDCPGREVFNHITNRWALLILAALRDGPLRFHLLRDRVGGISEKMLSQTLKVLGRDGLVHRSVEPTIPPQVSYELTEIGAELSEQFADLIQWMGRRVPDILLAQQTHDEAMSGRPRQ